MSLFLFLTVVQAIVAFSLVCVILMQRSEGGGLGIGGGGGSPGGLMSARGAADFMTRITKWLAVMFVTLSIALAAVAIGATSGREIDGTLDRSISEPTESTDGLLPADGVAEGEAVPAQDDALTGIAE